MEVCNLCTKAFSNQSNLRKHIKSVHEKMKFKCEICGKEFSQKDNLQRLFIQKILNLNVQFVKKNLVEKTTCWHIKISVANVDIATTSFPRHRCF